MTSPETLDCKNGLSPEEELLLEKELLDELKALTSTLEMTRPVLPQPVENREEVLDFSPEAEPDSLQKAAGEAEKDGWRIARQAMVRDFLVLSGRGIVGFVLLFVVGFSALFCWQKLSTVKPSEVMQTAGKIFPALEFANKTRTEQVESESPESPENARKVVEKVKTKIAARPKRTRRKTIAAHPQRR